VVPKAKVETVDLDATVETVDQEEEGEGDSGWTTDEDEKFFNELNDAAARRNSALDLWGRAACHCPMCRGCGLLPPGVYEAGSATPPPDAGSATPPPDAGSASPPAMMRVPQLRLLKKFRNPF
jgi:hypothetical protein